MRLCDVSYHITYGVMLIYLHGFALVQAKTFSVSCEIAFGEVAASETFDA